MHMVVLVGQLLGLLTMATTVAGRGGGWPTADVGTYAPSGCFGGAGHTAALHTARYGHTAGAGNCGEMVLPRSEQRTSSVLSLVSRGKGGVTKRLRWQGNETALIIIDMWHYHPCKTVTNRAGALVPRMNAVAAGLRKAGGHVVFAPTEAAESFDGWEQREAVLSQPLLTVPPFAKPIYNFSDSQNVVGSDDMCSSGGHGCVWNYGSMFQNPAMRIATSDFIVQGDSEPKEIYSLLKRLNISNVIVGGIAENICVQGKTEGIPTLQRLGFNPVLARDLTDAQTHYDPDSFVADDRPWVHPDWGTVNVTRWVENGTPWTEPLATTVEAGLVAKALGTYWEEGKDEPIEPILHAPWGTQLRPHIFDLQKYTAQGPVEKDGTKMPTVSRDFTSGQPVTLSTACWGGKSARRALGCGQPVDIRYTLDGSSPTVNSLNFTKPFFVASTTVVKAAGFARATGRQMFAESQSVLVARPKVACLVSDKAGSAATFCSPGLWSGWPARGTCTCPPMYQSNTQKQQAAALIDISVAPIMWGYGDDASYRQRPQINKSWTGAGLHYRNTAFASGLGLKAPMHLHYNVTQLCILQPAITHLMAAVGTNDAGCLHGGAGRAPYNCNGIASWQNSVVLVYVDGSLAAESPVLQAETLRWIFEIEIPPKTKLLRIVVKPVMGTLGTDGTNVHEASPQPAMQQNSYDYVDLVGGFYGLGQHTKNTSESLNPQEDGTRHNTDSRQKSDDEGRAPPCPVVGGVCDAATCAGGHVAGGDSSPALGTAFASGAHTVLVKNMGSPWLVAGRLSLALANQTVRLEAGAVIEAQRWVPFWNNSGKPGPIAQPRPLIQTAQAGSTNVSIVGAPGATLRMQKADYMDYTRYPVLNEWRHGIYISGSTDITITDLAIESTGGDGICVSWESQRIHLARLVVNNAYRNGLSITNGRDMVIEDTTFANTSGTPPESGCDIEPDEPYTWLKNISFRRCRFSGNEGAGLSLAPGQLKPFKVNGSFAGKGCADYRTSDDSPACPMSISVESCSIGQSMGTPKSTT